MTNPEPENIPEESAPVAQPFDQKRRLRELLSVPERDRTDEQWDEIIELEIQLAPGNRISGNEQGGNPGRSSGHPRPAGGGQVQKKHRPRQNSNNNNNSRRPRQNKPPSSGGGTPV